MKSRVGSSIEDRNCPDGYPLVPMGSSKKGGYACFKRENKSLLAFRDSSNDEKVDHITFHYPVEDPEDCERWLNAFQKICKNSSDKDYLEFDCTATMAGFGPLLGYGKGSRGIEVLRGKKKKAACDPGRLQKVRSQISFQKRSFERRQSRPAPSPVKTLPPLKISHKEFEKILKSKSKPGTKVINLEKATVKEALRDLSKVLGQAGMNPFVPTGGEGKVQGFRFTEIKKAGIFDHLKFQIDDVVLQVNDLEIDSPTKAMDLYNQLKENDGPVEVLVLRNKKLLKLIYVLK